MERLEDYQRDHPDPLADHVPPLLLDRQRIVHAAAFRRLQHKTQVFVAPRTDHVRTRLTHTLEVAHQARVIAHRLDARTELAEVIALAHDLGHPPFGHAGERALAACMHDHGGFEHNRHTLRVVEALEHPYPDFHGLNLTRIVRRCLASHDTPFDQPAWHPLRDAGALPIESGIVALADRLAYLLHDLQDGVYADLLKPQALLSCELWRQVYDGPRGSDLAAWRPHLRPALDRIQSTVLDAIVCPDTGAASVLLTSATDAQVAALERILRQNLYASAAVQEADTNAARRLTHVFDAFTHNPTLLPERYRQRIHQTEPHRVVADYVAGMTDRYCNDVYERICQSPEA